MTRSPLLRGIAFGCLLETAALLALVAVLLYLSAR